MLESVAKFVGLKDGGATGKAAQLVGRVIEKEFEFGLEKIWLEIVGKLMVCEPFGTVMMPAVLRLVAAV